MDEHTLGDWKCDSRGIRSENGLFGPDGEAGYVLYPDGGKCFVRVADSKLIEMAPRLLRACKGLCKSIRIMGEIACLNDLGDVPPERIEAEWLNHIPVCQVDAYMEAREIIDKLEGVK